MSGWRHARRYLFGAMAVLVALLLLFLVIRLLPAVDEDEVVEARRQIEALRESATHLSCDSDPPGDALERSAQEGLRDLFDWSGSFNACHRVAGTAEVYDALKGLPDAHPGEPGRQWRFSVEDQDLPVAAMAEGWGALSFQAPLYSSVEVPPVFLSVRDACAGLSARLRDIAESRRGCSPFAVTDPGIDPLRLQVFSVAKAASVIARGRAAAGDVEGALASAATLYSLERILAWGVFLGPRAVRGFTNRELRANYLADITTYVKRLMRSPIQIAMAKVMLELLAFRRQGICPDEVALAPTWLEVPLLGERISIRKLRGQEFELDAPSIVTPGDPGLLPLMLFLCPATDGGVWVD